MTSPTVVPIPQGHLPRSWAREAQEQWRARPRTPARGQRSVRLSPGAEIAAAREVLSACSLGRNVLVRGRLVTRPSTRRVRAGLRRTEHRGRPLAIDPHAGEGSRMGSCLTRRMRCRSASSPNW